LRLSDQLGYAEQFLTRPSEEDLIAPNAPPRVLKRLQYTIMPIHASTIGPCSHFRRAGPGVLQKKSAKSSHAAEPLVLISCIADPEIYHFSRSIILPSMARSISQYARLS